MNSNIKSDYATGKNIRDLNDSINQKLSLWAKKNYKLYSSTSTTEITTDGQPYLSIILFFEEDK